MQAFIHHSRIIFASILVFPVHVLCDVYFRLGAWQFMADMPYSSVSHFTLWKILWTLYHYQFSSGDKAGEVSGGVLGRSQEQGTERRGSVLSGRGDLDCIPQSPEGVVNSIRGVVTLNCFYSYITCVHVVYNTVLTGYLALFFVKRLFFVNRLYFCCSWVGFIKRYHIHCPIIHVRLILCQEWEPTSFCIYDVHVRHSQNPNSCCPVGSFFCTQPAQHMLHTHAKGCHTPY